MMCPTHGLLELVAAYPAMATSGHLKSTSPSPKLAAEKGGQAESTAAQLRLLFASVFNGIKENEIATAGLDVTPGWDSLAQLRVIMEVEKRFKVQIPMHLMDKLTSHDLILAHLLGIIS